jgi:hypothetical protein
MATAAAFVFVDRHTYIYKPSDFIMSRISCSAC